MFKPQRRTASLGHLQAFLEDTRGQITLGEIAPIRRAALAAQGKKVRVRRITLFDGAVFTIDDGHAA